MKYKFFLNILRFFLGLLMNNKNMIIFLKIIFLNVGFIIYIFMGFRLVNWLNDSLRKNKGILIRVKEIKYGIRKVFVK